MTPTKAGLLYAIQAEAGGPVKLGWTGRELRERLRDHQTASAFCLRVVWQRPGTLKDEARLLKRFEHLRLHGEWFRPSSELSSLIPDLVLSDCFRTSDEIDSAWREGFEAGQAKARLAADSTIERLALRLVAAEHLLFEAELEQELEDEVPLDEHEAARAGEVLKLSTAADVARAFRDVESGLFAADIYVARADTEG